MNHIKQMYNPDNKTVVTRKAIIEGLNAVGIGKGSNIMVHSALSKFGYVEDGATGFIEALQETVTNQGTLLLPSFNHGNCSKAGFYDPKVTETFNGTVARVFWKMPDVNRSLNPSHPFAAWGKNAERYTEFHHRDLTMGESSPMGLLLKDEGESVLFGLGYKVNTFHHYVEQTYGCKCIAPRTEVCNVILPDGKIVEGRYWGWRDGDCYFTDSGLYGEVMEERSLHRKGMIGDAEITVFKLSDCLNVIREILDNGTADKPSCRFCNIKPYTTANTRESDWDEVNKCLKPWSESLKY
jgi:aminoglycoside 3-N-acetyltransferase